LEEGKISFGQTFIGGRIDDARTVLGSGRVKVCLPFKHPQETVGTFGEASGARSFAKGNVPSVHERILEEHRVLRPDILTSKLGVVFDASATTSRNISLNDIVMVCPTI